MRTWATRWPPLRDVTLFVAGLAGTAYETIHGPVEPVLVVLFATMMGLPGVLGLDRRRGDG